MLTMLFGIPVPAIQAEDHQDNADHQDNIVFRSKEIEIPLSDLNPGSEQLPDRPSFIVRMNGVIINDFTRLSPQSLFIVPPLKQGAAAFILTVEDNKAQTIYQKKYRRPAKGEVFDKVETRYEFDLASNMVRHSQPIPAEEDFDSFTADANAQARLSVHARRGKWTIGLENDWQGVSNKSQSLRPDGSRIDLDRGQAFIRYADPSQQMQINIGDIQVSGINPLVFNGMNSRGAHIFYSGLKGRFRISAAQIFGIDIRGLTEAVLPIRKLNYRRSLEMEVDILKSSAIHLSLSTSFFKAERPSDFGFRLSNIPEGEKNTVRGIASKISLFDQSFNINSEIAWASYDNPANLNVFNFVENNLITGETKGNAHHIRVAWEGWSGQISELDSAVSLFADYRKNGALFNAIQAGIQADLDRREMTGNFQVGRMSLAASHIRLVNNIDDIAGILKTKRQQTELNTLFDLSRDREGEEMGRAWRNILPDTIEISFRREREETLNGDIVILHSSLDGSELPDTSENNWNFSLTWNWQIGSTSLSYADSFYDVRQIGRDSADRQNRIWTVSQSFFGETWEVEGHATWARDDNLDENSKSRDNQIDWGANFGLRLPDMPILSIRYDQGYSKSEDFIFLENSKNRTKRFDLTVDFTPYIANWWSGEFAPNVSLNIQYSDGIFQSDFFEEKTRQSAVTLNFSKRF